MTVDLRRRIVEVIGASPLGIRHGSGCIVAGPVVITAAHVIANAAEVIVRTPNKARLAATIDPRFVGNEDGPAPDLALVEISDPPESLPAIRLARINRGGEKEADIECHVYGYPSFADTDLSGRELVDTKGTIGVLSGIATGLISVTVQHSPAPLPLEDWELPASPWSGVSGGPVIVDGMLLGVVTVHAPRQGQSTITATPISAIEHDPAHPRWGDGVEDPGLWWSRLGVRGLVYLTAVPAVRHEVLGLPDYVPTHVRGRAGERDALRALVADKATVLCELRGPAGVGKTALAAELARNYDGRAAFLTATGYTGVNVTAVLDALAGAVSGVEAQEELLAQLRRPESDPLTRLGDVFVALADDPALLVVDNAEVLLAPDGRLRDEGLTAIFTAIANTRGHRIQVLFVTASEVGRRSTPSLQLPAAGPVFVEGDLPASDYSLFVDDIAKAWPASGPKLSAPELDRITGRHLRWTEILLGLQHSSDLPDAAGPRRLTEAVMTGLRPEHARAVEALAVCGRPVGAAAVAHLTSLPRDDAQETLRELADRRIVRRTGDQYHLSGGQAEGITRWLGPEVVETERRRAASYFEAAARRQHPSRLDQCADWFNAIDLYASANDPVRALDAMAEVDRRHLREWGHSDALLPWLRDLSNRLTETTDRVRHLSLLARALGQYGKLDESVKELARAIKLNLPLQDRQRNVSLSVQLAGQLFQSGRIGVAAEYYKLAAAQAHVDDRPGTAEAAAGMALCEAQTGRFDEALRQVDAAHRSLAARGRNEETRLLEAGLDYSRALIELELGDDVRCVESVSRVRDAAFDLEATLLLARCDDLEARVHLHRGRPDDALPLAARACKAAFRIGSPELARIAGTTYATALLRRSQFQKALKVAASATRFKRSLFVAEALAVEGVAAFRVDESSDRARAAFAQAIDFATNLRTQEWRNYRAWETAAIAEVGLILIDGRTTTWQAETAYKQAIANSGDCAGGKRRRWELFDILTAGRAPDSLSRVQTIIS
ncbi:trypsin-like peptidase domain-containing protein [Actinoplanes sp. NPDC049596]|uniref:trypsin-like peptidase domain-containing protein n=1 Tax=unclassified Actinoplanes TaxID=2626549 RepID=UPI003439D7BD